MISIRFQTEIGRCYDLVTWIGEAEPRQKLQMLALGMAVTRKKRWEEWKKESPSGSPPPALLPWYPHPDPNHAADFRSL